MQYPIYPIKPFKAGNSLVVTIPRHFTLKLDLNPGQCMYVTIDDHNRLIYADSPKSLKSAVAPRPVRRK